MSFTAILRADLDAFKAGINEANSKMAGLTSNVESSQKKMNLDFKKLAKGVAGIVAAVSAAAAGIVVFAKKAGDAASDLSSLSAAVDASTDTIQEFRHIATMAGTSTESFTQGTAMLIRRLKDISGEGVGAASILQSLGVSIEDANGAMRRAGDISSDTIVALSMMEDTTKRNVLASQLFGGQWTNIASILDMGAGAILKAKDEAHELGLVMSEDSVGSLAQFSVEMNKLGNMFGKVGDKLASYLVPILSDFLPFIEEKLIPALISAIEWLAEKWEEYGSDIISVVKIVFDVVRDRFNLIATVISGVAKTLKGIFALDYKMALEGLKDIFGGAFDYIQKIVLKYLSVISAALQSFFNFLGMEKTAAKLGEFAERMNNALEKVKQKTEETTKTTRDYSLELENIKSKINENINLHNRSADAIRVHAEMISKLNEASKKGQDEVLSTPLIRPKIDMKPLEYQLVDLEYRFFDLGEALKSAIGKVITDFAAAIGQGLAEGGNIISTIGKGLLKSLSGLAMQIGAYMIAFGTAALALKPLLVNPLTAIAAGAALVALGAAATAAVGGSVAKATGTPGVSGTVNYSMPRDSQVRGAYRDEAFVEFKIKGDDLVGVLSKTNNKRVRV